MISAVEPDEPASNFQQRDNAPQHDAVGLAGAEASDHQQRTVQMPNHLGLRAAQVWVVLGDGWSDAHGSLASWKSTNALKRAVH
jgi:hypothetical protein